MLVVVKGLLFLNIVENLWMKQFGLQKDPQLVFPSHKCLIKEVLPYMMTCTLKKFVLPYVNAMVLIITTFG
jgi:hypothetical protein